MDTRPLDMGAARSSSAIARSPYNAISTRDDSDSTAFLAMPNDDVERGRAATRSHMSGLPVSVRCMAGTAAALVCVSAAIALGVIYGKPSSDAPAGDDGCAYHGYRLQSGFTPESYDINVAPLFVAPFTFDGVTTVNLTVTTGGLRCIQLHALGLRVESSSVRNLASGETVAASVLRYDAANERVVLSLPSAYGVGTRIALTVAYNATLGDAMHGLYRSTYVDDSNATVNLVATQFESTFARQMFPCFDEPAFKAVFNVAIDGVPAGYTALSNMQVTSTGPSPRFLGSSLFRFAPTPRISTYLVALTAAPYTSVTTTLPSGMIISVYGVTKKANVGQLDYALAVAAAVVPKYEQLFGMVLPLTKIDMVAIPDFAAGAMENIGLVTYRESALLCTEASSASDKQRVTVVVAHELAHFWFGDIVTMAWWSSLWLNEGFATLIEFVGADFAHPDLEIGRQFQSSDIFVAQRATHWGHARALSPPLVDSSADIESQFDGVAYSFGGSVLYMVRDFMQRKQAGSFYAGVAAYIAKFAFSNGQPADLWAALAGAGSLPELSTYLSGYTDQIGYPLVTLSWADPASATTGVGSLTVSQQRHFLSNYSRAAVTPATAADYTWWVPLTLGAAHPAPGSPVPAAAAAALASNGFTTRVWASTIGSADAAFDLARDGPIHANLGGAALQRVNYPANIWAAWRRALAANVSTLLPMERGQMLDDIFTFAEGGIDASVDSSFVLTSFLPYLSEGNETAYEAWMPALSHLLTLRGLLYDDSGAARGTCPDDLAAYARNLIANIVATVGFDVDGSDPSPLNTLLRASVLNAASVFREPSTLAEAERLWDEFIANPAVLPPVNLQSLVFNSAVRAHGANAVGALKGLLKTTDAAAARRMLSSLAQAQDLAVLDQVLQLSLDPTWVRAQDTVGLITAVAANPIGRGLAFEFLGRPNVWETLYARYGEGGFAFSSLVGGTSAGFTTQASLDAVTNFYAGKGNEFKAATLDLQQALESIGTRSAWVTNSLTATCNALRQQ